MISAGGLTLADSWHSVREGRWLLQPASAGYAETAQLLVAEIRGFDPDAHFERREVTTLDPVAQFAVIAAREAVAMAGIDLAQTPPERTRCIVGSGAGGERTHDDASRKVYGEGAARLHPMTVPRIMLSGAASQVALDQKIMGGVFAVSSACASAAHAVGQAFADIRAGVVDVALAGGSESCLSHGCMKAWQALHILSDTGCRPFSLGRRGLVLGEGAAMFVLEAYDVAAARGADILAELIGFGMSCDAGSITAPNAGGMARAIGSALGDAQITADAVDHVNAHGTGTQANDVTECAALRLVFGDRLPHIPVTANKSVLGHALGASGAFELAMSMMSLREQVLPCTAHFESPDPACPIDCIPHASRDAEVTTILSNSFAFGGLNAALLVQRV
ncbi:beta-ketoacyl-[acyl-carrier-protein] synthase family protein [Sphingomonas sp.]|uniref:beta-ketoacyl-[acyl-carrier-protein] synthase family protein n=1 Tax=Sphingomonas sp. TaxID=28214 RepID=UPI0028A78400|nr:beta-ketoacyl-[acyl-carrier-protein] synthase family protein [Sphingomonas sp.]